MEPFGELSIPQFADFLANAEVYLRTGAVPVTGLPKRAAPRSSTKPGGPEAVAAAVDRIKSLYERVCAPKSLMRTLTPRLRASTSSSKSNSSRSPEASASRAVPRAASKSSKTKSAAG